MMAAQIIWKGTQTEALELQQCLQNHCMCEFNQESGERSFTCAPHRMLAEDQRALDGLIFARRIVACLLREEFCS